VVQVVLYVMDCESAVPKKKKKIRERPGPTPYSPERGGEKRWRATEKRIQSSLSYGSVVKRIGITWRKSFNPELKSLDCLMDTINMSRTARFFVLNPAHRTPDRGSTLTSPENVMADSVRREAYNTPSPITLLLCSCDFEGCNGSVSVYSPALLVFTETCRTSTTRIFGRSGRLPEWAGSEYPEWCESAEEDDVDEGVR